MSTLRRPVLLTLAIGALIVLANIGVNRTFVAWDVTAERSATLSDTTHRVLRSLDYRVMITAFFPRNAPGRVDAATLLSRYRKANRKISFRILDPAIVPGEADRLGIQQIGSAGVEDLGRADRIEVAQLVIEIDLTTAIARLVRGVDAAVCFTSGHGEREVGEEAPDGLAAAGRTLRSNGYRTREIDLLASPRVPAFCDAVVVAAPTSALETASKRALTGYLKRSGKALLLADPSSRVDLTPVSSPWGIRFERGIVLEGDDGSHLPNDVTSPIVSRYSGGSPAVRGLSPTFFPGVGMVTTVRKKDPGLSVFPVAFTSPLGYLDRDDVSSFDPKVDRKGPISVGAAADDSTVEAAGTSRARIKRTRILAWGDVDFATDRFIADAGNARLWIQAVDWLTQSEDLVTAAQTFPAVRNLELTEAKSRYILTLTAGIVPGLFLLAGGFVWVIRRGR